MKVALLTMKDVRLKESQIHKMRGYIGNLFKEYDLIHNHGEDGKNIFRYPRIQFKTTDNGNPVILAIGDDAIKIFSEIFMKLERIEINDRILRVNEKELAVNNCSFGISESMIEYEFIHPWIAFSQRNYHKYQLVKTIEEEKDLIKSILAGNIISMSKGLGYTVPSHIEVETTVNTQKDKLKGVDIVGFVGSFRTNFEIPDYFGIGKSVSRGFGTVCRIKK